MAPILKECITWLPVMNTVHWSKSLGPDFMVTGAGAVLGIRACKSPSDWLVIQRLSDQKAWWCDHFSVGIYEVVPQQEI